MSQLLAPNSGDPTGLAADPQLVEVPTTGAPERLYAGQPFQIAANVPERCRPSSARAAAAARVMGAAPPVLAVIEPSEEPGGAPAAAPAEKTDQPTADRRHLRVVEAPELTPAQRRRRARAIIMLGGGLLVAVGFALVYLHVLLAQRQFKLDSLNSQVQSQQATYQNLRLTVAQLESPQHIIATAEGQYGMTQPAKVTYLSPSVSIPTTAPSGSGTSATGASGRGTTGRPSSPQAPAGDADWPLIKSQLAGSP